MICLVRLTVFRVVLRQAQQLRYKTPAKRIVKIKIEITNGVFIVYVLVVEVAA